MGSDNRQHAVYQGVERQNIYRQYKDGNYLMWLFNLNLLHLSPVEYNVFGANGNTLSYRQNTNGDWVPYYRITDNMGSGSMVLNNQGEIVSSSIYDDWGQVRDDYFQQPNQTFSHERNGWVGKERDMESNLSDHGVRKYDYQYRRFTSGDALWEKYISWNPYQYCMGDPVNKVDVNAIRF